MHREVDGEAEAEFVPAWLNYDRWSPDSLLEACDTWTLYWQDVCTQHRFDDLTEVLCCAAEERGLDPTALITLANECGDGSMDGSFRQLYKPARYLIERLKTKLQLEIGARMKSGKENTTAAGFSQSKSEGPKVIAQKVAKLLRRPAAGQRFREQLVEFGRKNVARQQARRTHDERVTEHRQRVIEDCRLRDRQAGPPESGYEWEEFATDDSEGGDGNASGTTEPLAGWFPPPVDISEDPWGWSGKSPITPENYLLSCYVLLACCHDDQLRDERPPIIAPDMVASDTNQAETGLELFYTPPNSGGTNQILAAHKHRLSTAYHDVAADLKKEDKKREAQANLPEGAGASAAGHTAQGVEQEEEKPQYAFRREGESWRITYKDRVFTVGNYDGIAYIAILLDTPHTEIDASKLYDCVKKRLPRDQDPYIISSDVTNGFTSGTHQYALGDNKEDRKLYKQSSQDEIDRLEKERDGTDDPSEKAACNEEIENIRAQLQKDKDIHGNSRVMDDPQGKPRNCIGAAISKAMEKIGEYDHELSGHLFNTIRPYSRRPAYRPSEDFSWDISY